MPFSFQNPDYIGPALHDLGNSLNQIQAAKNADKQRQIGNYMKLVDVSMEGVRANHRDEILGDMEKFRNDAANVFVKAEQGNRQPDYKELTTIEDKKKALLTKVAQSELLQQSYKAAMQKAMELRAQNKLDPASMDALNKWSTTKVPIDQTQDPSMLVNPMYNEQEARTVQNGYFNRYVAAAKNSTQGRLMKDGTYTKWNYYPPEERQQHADALWNSDPQMQRFYQSKGLGKKDFVNEMVSAYAVNSEVDKPPVTHNNIKIDMGYGKNWIPKYSTDTPGVVRFDPTNSKPALLTKPLTAPDGSIVANAGDYFIPGDIKKDANFTTAGTVVKKAEMISYTDPVTKEVSMVPMPNAKPIPVTTTYKQVRPDLITTFGQPDATDQGKHHFEAVDEHLGYSEGAGNRAQTAERKYMYNGDLYSYDELLSNGVNVTARVADGTIKMNAKKK